MFNIVDKELVFTLFEKADLRRHKADPLVEPRSLQEFFFDLAVMPIRASYQANIADLGGKYADLGADAIANVTGNAACDLFGMNCKQEASPKLRDEL